MPAEPQTDARCRLCGAGQRSAAFQPQRPTFVAPWQVEEGMLIYLAQSSTTPSRVLDVGEATDARAFGALRFTVETYSLEQARWLPRRDVTAWPENRYRVEDQPQLWDVAARPAPPLPRPDRRT